MFWLLITLLLVLWVIPRHYLGGPDCSRYDLPKEPPMRAQASEERHAAVAALGNLVAASQGAASTRLARLRSLMDSMGDGVAFDGEIRPVNAGSVRAEWVLAPGHDPDRRLLYIHGGAYTMGSPKSHRYVTTELSRLCGAAVLVIDYRLMPENPRRAGIEDSQEAYRWLLGHAPDGERPARHLFVAGDSAGGNLTLMLLAWARDTGQRVVDAAAALSPSADSSFSSPSMRTNIPTDHMLGPMFGKMMRIPQPVWLWMSWFGNRIRPCDPIVSPLFGDLGGLPPLLVHASESEMLRDDARRYVNKARASGSPATLETWPDMLHVWHFFGRELPEGREALERIAAFFERAAPRA